MPHIGDSKLKKTAQDDGIFILIIKKLNN